MKVGLIGIGGMGFVHFNCYKKMADMEIAVADVRVDMAKEKVNDASINVYGSLTELLANEDVDFVDICTPSYLHAELTVAALNAGKHVLCEKPMSTSSEESAKMIEAAEKNGKLLMVAHVVRFMAPYAYLREVIKSNELGRLLRLDMKRVSAIPTWSWEDWMRDEKRSGGVTTDLSIHDLDFVQSVLGMPDTIQSYRYNMKDNNDTVVTNMTYGDTLVSCEGTWYNTGIPFHATFLAVFQNGSLELSDKLYKNGVPVEAEEAKAEEVDLGINVGNDDGYLNEMQYFVNCIIENKKPDFVTAESSAQSVLLADMIKKKAKKL